MFFPDHIQTTKNRSRSAKALGQQGRRFGAPHRCQGDRPVGHVGRQLGTVHDWEMTEMTWIIPNRIK